MRFRFLLVAAMLAAFAGAAGTSRSDMFGPSLTDAQHVIADTQLNAGAMTITAAPDRPDKNYAVGQPIALSVSVSKNASLAILRVLANGETTIVFPNRLHPSAAVAANATLVVPAADDAVNIAPDKSGLVLFEFIASTASEAWPFKRTADPGSDVANLGVTTRSTAHYLSNTFKTAKPGVETAATTVVVNVGR